jgi:DNA transposition AAA+ family ATPase
MLIKFRKLAFRVNIRSAIQDVDAPAYAAAASVASSSKLELLKIESEKRIKIIDL